MNKNKFFWTSRQHTYQTRIIFHYCDQLGQLPDIRFACKDFFAAENICQALIIYVNRYEVEVGFSDAITDFI